MLEEVAAGQELLNEHFISLNGKLDKLFYDVPSYDEAKPMIKLPTGRRNLRRVLEQRDREKSRIPA